MLVLSPSPSPSPLRISDLINRDRTLGADYTSFTSSWNSCFISEWASSWLSFLFFPSLRSFRYQSLPSPLSAQNQVLNVDCMQARQNISKKGDFGNEVRLLKWAWFLNATWSSRGHSDQESASNAADVGLIPGSGRSPRLGNGNPLQYSCLENSMHRGAWWATVPGVAKSQTWLSGWACTGFLSHVGLGAGLIIEFNNSKQYECTGSLQSRGGFRFPQTPPLEAHQVPGGPELSCLCFPPASAFGLLLPCPACVLSFPLPTWRLEPQSPLHFPGLNTLPLPVASFILQSPLSTAKKLHPTHARVQSSL